jgi:DNA primase
VPEAVATCGTALTPSHARLLRRFVSRVVLSFDCDEAGQRAAERSGELLLAEDLEVRVLQLPEGHDPDSFLRERGGDAYRALVESAPHYVEWRADRAARECDVSTPPGKAAYLKAVLPALRRIESAVERSAWIPVVAERGGLDPAATRLELRRALGDRSAEAGPAPAAAAPPPRRERLLPAERLLLTLILKGAGGVDEALGELSEADLQQLASAPVLRCARAVYLRGEPVSAAAIRSGLEDEAAQRLVNETAVESIPTEKVTPLDCVRELRGHSIEARIAEIRRAVSSARADALDALLQEQLELKQRLADLARAGQGSARH